MSFHTKITATKNLLKMGIKRDFKGNTGLAVKNSIFQFSSTFTAKLGSLIFTFIIARLLMPELYGLYSLALTTIVLFTTLSDLGIFQTTVRFIAKSLGKNHFSQARAYFNYFLRIKILLSLVSVIILLSLSKFLSQTYYSKPIFLSLIAGCVYIIAYGLASLFEASFIGSNEFKKPLVKELIFQVLRIIIVPLVIIISLKYFISPETIIAALILAIAFCYLVAFLFYFILFRKLDFMKRKSTTLAKSEKKSANKFILALSFISFSTLLFGYIDIIMLGHFVEAKFIGYYSAAINLAGSISVMIAFSLALLPLFSRMSGEQLKRGFNKSVRIIFYLSSLVFILTFIFAPLIVRITYGPNFNETINLLRLLSLLLWILPISAVYESFFISQGRTKQLSFVLGVSTILNIVLNYFLIVFLLKYSFTAALFGAAISTLISRFVYLCLLYILNRKNEY